MKMYQEINGDLIKLALKGNFNVIAHGCNCMCKMKSGIAVQMDKYFFCSSFKMEHYTGIEKLGNIDSETIVLSKNARWFELTVINAYTQFEYGTDKIHLDYDALRLCLRKINHLYAGKTIGLPKIGCGLAGGDWNIVRDIIQKELVDLDVFIVIPM
jgi:O-acetyl-ADP-ribose deacetylase (regulator of RNase III)